MEKKDIKMTQNAAGYWDIEIDPATKDLTVDSSFDTNIEFSLFTDARADESQVSQPSDRRGWIGDVFTTLTGYKAGSLLWLLSQARLTGKVVNQAADYARKSLQWIIDKGYATQIDVTARPENNEDIRIFIKIYVNNDLIDSFTFRIWKNSTYA